MFPAEGGGGRAGVEKIPRGGARRRCPSRLFRRRRALGEQVIGRGLGASQRPLGLIPPVPPDENSTFRRPAAVAATHDEDADRRSAINTVLDALQPAIEPALPEWIEIESSLGSKLRFPGKTLRLASVSPRAHDESNRPFLGLRKLHVVQVGGLEPPGIVPP